MSSGQQHQHFNNHSHLQSNSAHFSSQGHHHHHCHHNCHSHCNGNHPQTAHFFYPPHPTVEMVNSEYQYSNKQSASKNGSVNDLISQALAESLKNQRQINDNIKAINEKIETLSVNHNHSSLSEAFSESIVKKGVHSPQNKLFGQYEREKERCHSEIKTSSRPSKKQQSHLPVPINFKKMKKQKEIQNIYSMKTERKKRVKGNKTKSKSSTKYKSEYYLSFGCPIHSPNKLSFVSPRKSEVYKDSQHRNRKHQKYHLLQAFNQQQRSKKNLCDKISHRVFN